MKNELDIETLEEAEEEATGFETLTVFEVAELIFDLILWCLTIGIIILAASITLYTIYDYFRIQFDWPYISTTNFFVFVISILLVKYLVDHYGPKSQNNIVVRFIQTTSVWKVLQRSTFIAIAWLTGWFCAWVVTGGHLFLCRFFRWICP